MQDYSSNSKRLAKNTLVLYFRMAFIILINLYMSRVILDTLGVEDYGIYNVVGGFVTMFSILSASLSNAISRFITFELGKGDLDSQKQVFSTSVTVLIILSVIIAILLEIIGLWFLNNKMQIPVERMAAAHWTLQCSIFTFVLNLISVPYNGCIIAHEHMTAFAYISILDVLLKLGSVFFLYLALGDNLIVYSVLIAISAFIVRLVYGIYCNRHFIECKFKFLWDESLIKKMISMASWNMLGAGGGILNDQGTNVAMNVFFGVTVNAARGIASQVNSAVQQFAASFITALNPQITKSYAQGDISALQSLVHRGIKFSYYLMLIISIPIIIEAPFILDLWLPVVPDYTVLFVRLTIVIALVTASGHIFFTAIMATGDIKRYQIVIGSLSVTIFIITLLLFYIGFPPYYSYIIHLIIDIVVLVARMILVNQKVDIDIKGLLFCIFPTMFIVTLCSSAIPVLLYIILKNPTSLDSVSIVIFSSLVCTAISVYYLGLNLDEKNFLKSIILSKIKRK